MVIWINGAFVEGDAARVSALDAGLQHGVGLFETMQARHGRVFRLADHLDRLAESAAELGLADPLRVEPLAQAVEQVMAKWARPDARVRLTLTGGVVNMLREARDGKPVEIEPTLMIVASPPTPFPEPLFEQGVGVMVADDRVSPLDRFGGHKTLWYWPRLAALRAAAQAGAAEALWFDVTNRLCCACTSNVFLVKGDRLLTPIARNEEPKGGLRSPVMPGIARRTVIGLAGECGLRLERASLTIDDVLGADEAFLTNVSWGVLPVVRVERSAIGGGTPGEATRRLRKAWLDTVEAQTSA
jgi:branched-chain amino acid aminotransferase